MKKKLIALFSFMLCICVLFASCADPINTLESFCFAVKDFELEKAASYVDDSAEGYFEKVLKYEQKLSEEQREIVKELFSQTSFTEFAEADGVYSVTVKHVDFSALIKDLNISLATGTESASEYINEIISSGRLKNQFLKTEKNVTVSLSEIDGKAKLPLGYSSVNNKFTEILGLDVFLAWYSTQR